MTVTLDLKQIKIESSVDWPNSADIAIFEIGIEGAPFKGPIICHVQPFQSLDEALETARQQIAQFAADLTEVAKNPLINLPKEPDKSDDFGFTVRR